MTGKKKDTAVQSIAEGSEGGGFVRSSVLPKVVDLYGYVKDYNSLIKYGLETVESRIVVPVDARIPEVWKSYTVSKADSLDEMLTSSIISPTINAVDATRTRVTDGIVTPVTNTVNTRVLEPVQRKRQQWKDLRGEMSKKAVQKMEQGLGKVVQFSSTRGKEILHVDLIEYSRMVLDNANTSAHATLDPVLGNLKNRLAHGVERVVQAKEELLEVMVAQKERALELGNNLMDALRTKLKQAIAAARELSESGLAFAKHKYQYLEDNYVPDKYAIKMQEAMKYLAHSPYMLQEVGEHADLDLAGKTVVDNIQSLMGAVKEVVFHLPPPAVDVD